MNNNYSFRLVPPKNFKSRFLKVEAANKAEAKEEFVKLLSKITKRLIKVYRLKEGSNE
tara:strand:- start:148 stop:321 length:174 start_codon:yes stop_codon:yes gene_type:complete